MNDHPEYVIAYCLMTLYGFCLGLLLMGVLWWVT